jgi:hypothetical protein
VRWTGPVSGTTPNVTSAGSPSRRRDHAEGSVSDSDLLVLAPWAVFIAGVGLLVLLAFTRSHGGDRRGGRRRSRSRRR